MFPISPDFHITDTYCIRIILLVLIHVSYTEYFFELIQTRSQPFWNQRVYTE